MQITRKQIIPLLNTIQILEKNENFSMLTKYKVLKIKEILQTESQYNSKLLQELINKYGSITEDGSVLIKNEFIIQADKELIEFNNDLITLPDLYFSLEELEDKDISWTALESFMPFIKE